MSDIVPFPSQRFADTEGQIGDYSRKRWLVEARYSDGMMTAQIDELDEIGKLVERWPDWTLLIEPIKITYQL